MRKSTKCLTSFHSFYYTKYFHIQNKKWLLAFLGSHDNDQTWFWFYALVVVYGMHPLIVFFISFCCFLLLLLSFKISMLLNTCEYCYSNTQTWKGRRNEDDSLGLICPFIVCTNTHLCIGCILSELLHLSPGRTRRDVYLILCSLCLIEDSLFIFISLNESAFVVAGCDVMR